MIRLFLAVIALMSLSIQGAAASSSCYSMAEAEAEQGIRIHSELMVIGLNCQNMRFSDGTNLYAEYRKFTAEHGDIFANYENTLLNYYKVHGVNDPEAKLNTLRTEFANQISMDAASMRPDLFCNRYAGRLMQAVGFSGSQIRQWAATIYPSHPVSNPICEQ